MQDNNLVSVVRLPNNLFTEYAGTEVGSDLIILQKNTNKSDPKGRSVLPKQQLNTIHQAMRSFIITAELSIPKKLDTDPYGQPA
jgi:hypothetical protein